MDILGWKIDGEKENKSLQTFSPKETDDGALTVTDAGGAYGLFLDMEGAAKNEAELIGRYRDMSMYPEVESAIDDIVNEVITNDPDEPQVKIVLDELEISDRVKQVIEDEFENVLKLLEFNKKSYEIFKTWYIDGRIYYHLIIDTTKPQEGIQELRYIDPRKIKKVREEKVQKAKGTAVDIRTTVKEYYVYSDKGFTESKRAVITPTENIKGIKIAKDAIAHLTSGLMDSNRSMALSYLHKAIKPLNQLKAMEDALVIYRISRAPERRIFYIDVGTLPPAKAEAHINNMMNKFKNKVTYDSATGAVRDDRKFMTTMEDFWLARRGEKGTEITTLPGGQNLGELTDVQYFQQKLYKALSVPVSRIDPQNDAFNLGRSTQISRDEVKFQKFVSRLRLRFQDLFTLILGRQLILKGVATDEDWKQIQDKIAYRFSEDNFFSELKKIEIMQERLNILDQMDKYAGKYFSHDKIRKDVLQQTDEDIQKEDFTIAQEMSNPQYMVAFGPQLDGLPEDEPAKTPNKK